MKKRYKNLIIKKLLSGSIGKIDHIERNDDTYKIGIKLGSNIQYIIKKIGIGSILINKNEITYNIYQDNQGKNYILLYDFNCNTISYNGMKIINFKWLGKTIAYKILPIIKQEGEIEIDYYITYSDDYEETYNWKEVAYRFEGIEMRRVIKEGLRNERQIFKNHI